MIPSLNYNSDNEIMILGSGGQLGSELRKLYPGAVCYYHSPDSPNLLDFSNLKKLEETIIHSRVRWIINAAAFTNVDMCEMNKEIAYSVNGMAIKSIVKASIKIGANLVHISTDYIFDGVKGYYKEFDTPNPLNYYGISKLIGETFAQSYENSIVVRTSGVYGYKNNFPIFSICSLE